MKVSVILGLIVAIIKCNNALRLSRGNAAVQRATQRSSSNKLNEQSSYESVHEVREIKGLQEGLRMRKIPNTEIVVSELCLGTMMFGDQVSKMQAAEQLDLATKTYGLNFIDTAESYPAPSAASTAGQSEKIIGEWLRKSKSTKREDLVISTKVCGFSDQLTWVRKDGQGTRVSREQVTEAVDAQLKRLGTDYIDVLQVRQTGCYLFTPYNCNISTNAMAHLRFTGQTGTYRCLARLRTRTSTSARTPRQFRSRSRSWRT